jgi:YHS domain-containing protein
MNKQVLSGTESFGQPIIDPVCGMEFDPATSEYQLDRGDDIVHFCCAGCRATFAADPEKYSERRARGERSYRRSRRDLHVPDALGDSPKRDGQLPVLRHDALAGGRTDQPAEAVLAPTAPRSPVAV